MTLVQIDRADAIRVFPFRTSFTPEDERAFVGQPPLFRPADRTIPVFVSVTFTWHKAEAERIALTWRDHYDDVRIGGPAYGDYGDEFVAGRFLKTGCTITSRGCVKHCGWCPERNRPLRELRTIAPGWIVQDSNLLACSERHVRAVFEMLRQQDRAIFFKGGLDKDFLRSWHRPLFDSIKIGELWFACDRSSGLRALENAAAILDGIPTRCLRCYSMIGDPEGCYSMIGDPEDPDTFAEATQRLERIYELGFLPFCQLYRPDEGPRDYAPEWKALQRKWARPAAYRGKAA